MSKSRSLHQKPAKPCTQLMPVGHDLNPHSMRPPQLSEQQPEALFDEMLTKQLEQICTGVAAELKIPSQQLLNAMRTHCGERVAHIITLRSQFGLQNPSSGSGDGMSITIPNTIFRRTKYLLESDEALQQYITWTKGIHLATVTCDHGSFEVVPKNPNWIDFVIYKQRSKIKFRFLHTLVCTIAMQEDTHQPELKWVNPIYKPDGLPRTESQLRTIANICSFDQRRMQEIICMRKAIQRMIEDFRLGDPEEYFFQTSPCNESRITNP